MKPICHVAMFLLLFILLANFTGEAANAQIAFQWAPIQRVPGYGDLTEPPIMIADQNRTVHAFDSQFMGDNKTQMDILYRRWTLDGGWTTPVDILMSPEGQARIYGAFLDPNGMIHVLFFGGDDTKANMYYSRGLASEADDSRSWSHPLLIGEKAITPSTAAIAGDNRGDLVVLYSGNRDGNGIYATYSSNYGISWTDPSPIYLTYDNYLWPWMLNVKIGESGLVNAVWHVVDSHGLNITGLYASMNNFEQTNWSKPVEIAEGIGIKAGMGVSFPVVIENNSSILLMYNNGTPPSGIPPAEWTRQSNDSGQTWTEPVRPFPNNVGRNGVISLIVDSKKNVHALFAERIPLKINNDYAERGGIFHSVRQGTAWSEPDEIAARTYIPGKDEDITAQPGAVKKPDFAPYDARAVISQGNVILVTWRTDPGEAFNGVWYSFAKIDAPELPLVPLPPFHTPSTLTPIPSIDDIAATQTSALSPVFSQDSKTPLPLDVKPQRGANPALPILIAIIPTILTILLSVMLYQLVRYDRH